METKELEFGNFTITFVKSESGPSAGKWLVPCRMVGNLLNYSEHGQRLCNEVSTTWSKHPRWDNDSFLLRPGDFSPNPRSSTQMTPDTGVIGHQTLYLTVRGVFKIIFRCRAEIAKQFKGFLINKGAEVVQEGDVPKYDELAPTRRRRTKATTSVGSPGAEMAAVNATKIDKAFPAADSFARAIRFSEEMGYRNAAEIDALVTNYLSITYEGACLEAGLVGRPMSMVKKVETGVVETEIKVPLFKEPTQDPTLIFNSKICKRMFRALDRSKGDHPSYVGYVSTQEIAWKVNLSKTTVGSYLTRFYREKSAMTPAAHIVALLKNPAYRLEGPDDFGYLISGSCKDPGIAAYVTCKNGVNAWSNLQSPETANEFLRFLSGTSVRADLFIKSKGWNKTYFPVPTPITLLAPSATSLTLVKPAEQVSK